MTVPGRGAAHLAPPPGLHVYVVRSRRTGEVSIGVDLTPNGACPLACDYCQVPRSERTRPGPVDVARVRRELSAALEESGAIAGDVVFAGSGEPTWPSEFPDALGIARALVRARGLAIPVRVLTGGTTLGRPEVASALETLVVSGDGEVWIKLDAWDEETHRRFWGTRGQAEHEARITAFGARVPVVLQVMLVHRADAVTVEQTARGLAETVGRLLASGGRIDRVVLSTLFRVPGVERADLSAYGREDLERVRAALRASKVAVAVPPPALA